MKRWIAFLLILAMIGSLLAGCSEKEEETFTVNAYVAGEWADVGIWAWSETEGDLFESWPGEGMETSGNGWYSYEVPTWVDHVIINGYGGREQTGDIPVVPQDLYILVYSDSSASVTYLDPALHENPWDGCAIIRIDGTEDAPYESYSVPETKAPDVYVEPNLTDPGYTAQPETYQESVRLKDGNLTLNVSALCFRETVYNCTELTVNMNVQMNAGTHCKDWQLWGRCGGKFVKLAKVYLPAGDGFGSQNVSFGSPVTFDALVLTPTIPGGYSWSIALTITDVRTQ